MTDEKKKRYYSISDVAEMLEIKSHILRYWEGEFSILRPRKNRAGNRAYTERDIKIALLIKQLLYEEKFTIEGAKKRLKTDDELENVQQLEIPFDKIRKKTELKEIRDELVKLLNAVKSI
jgi:DNA-binding transcriptional MerR regulator